MSDVLPSELLWGILSHVPVKTLLRFRCVCSEWREIMDDPTFIQFHLQCQAGRELVMIRSGWGEELYTFSLEFLYNNFEIWAEPLKSWNHGVSCMPKLPVAMCNGLILISPIDEKEVWSLLNPYTRKSFELPPYDDAMRGSWPCSGLGYDPATEDYKVVRIEQFYDRNNNSYMLETSIYSLKLGGWRRIEDFRNCDISWRGEGVFVNGALHWRANVRLRDGTDDEGIFAFDLGTEKYSLLPMPSDLLFAPNKQLGKFNKDLSVLDGCLFLSCIYSTFRVDGWIMKDSCGVTNSWTKLFSFIPESSEIGKGEQMRFIAYLKKKGQVLIQHKYDELFWLDVENKSAKRVTICGAPYYFTSQVFPASLVRLNDNNGDGGDGSIFTKRSSRKED